MAVVVQRLECTVVGYSFFLEKRNSRKVEKLQLLPSVDVDKIRETSVRLTPSALSAFRSEYSSKRKSEIKGKTK